MKNGSHLEYRLDDGLLVNDDELDGSGINTESAEESHGGGQV